MKTKLWGMLLLSLITFTQAQAATYNCKSDVGSTQLSIEEKILFPNTRNAVPGAIVVLVDGPISKTYQGPEVRNFEQVPSFLESYKLSNAEGENATLKISTVISSTNGGRCGRCSPIYETSTYAKLITNQEEMDFTCHLVTATN